MSVAFVRPADDPVGLACAVRGPWFAGGEDEGEADAVGLAWAVRAARPDGSAGGSSGGTGGGGGGGHSDDESFNSGANNNNGDVDDCGNGDGESKGEGGSLGKLSSLEGNRGGGRGQSSGEGRKVYGLDDRAAVADDVCPGGGGALALALGGFRGDTAASFVARHLPLALRAKLASAGVAPLALRPPAVGGSGVGKGPAAPRAFTADAEGRLEAAVRAALREAFAETDAALIHSTLGR